MSVGCNVCLELNLRFRPTLSTVGEFNLKQTFYYVIYFYYVLCKVVTLAFK